MSAHFIDASEWQQLEWLNTGGTRAKRVLQSPDGNEWYFKRSEKKPAKDGNPEKYYKHEFWSEVIAYQLGNYLGLNVLQYDVAVHDNEIGCISPLMINRGEEQLIEIGRYMTSLNPDFLPEVNAARKEYTFQLLESTINTFGFQEYLNQVFQTMLFDAVIGNTDRHQENWAMVGSSMSTMSVYNRLADELKLYVTEIIRMAPIYDNGSSFGRELSDERINQLLSNELAFQTYVNNGKSEIHWQNQKLAHFDFIGKLTNTPYLTQVKEQSSFLSKLNDDVVIELITNVDNNIPEDWQSYCIPNNRKSLMIKLITLRSKILKGFFNDRI